MKAPFLQLAGSHVNSAVRTYLNLAEMAVENGVLQIFVREEGLIFMKKPAVQELLSQCAKKLGHDGIELRKLGDRPAAAPASPAGGGLADILSSAQKLGVEIHTDSK